MIKIFKSNRDDNYVVYDTTDFDNHHTHVSRINIAETIRKNVTKGIIPKSKDPHLLISHIRVARDEEYVSKLKAILDQVEKSKKKQYYIQKENKKIKNEILDRLEILIHTGATFLDMSNRECCGYLVKIKNLIKVLPYDITVNYLFNKNNFYICYDDIILDRGFSVEIYSDFSCRLILTVNHEAETNKKFYNYNVQEISKKIINHMKVGDKTYG